MTDLLVSIHRTRTNIRQAHFYCETCPWSIVAPDTIETQRLANAHEDSDGYHIVEMRRS